MNKAASLQPLFGVIACHPSEHIHQAESRPVSTAAHPRNHSPHRRKAPKGRRSADTARRRRTGSGPDGLPRRTPEEFTDDLERLNSDLSGVTSAITAMAVAGAGSRSGARSWKRSRWFSFWGPRGGEKGGR